MDIARRWTDTWVIDLANNSEEQASLYAEPFAHVVRYVKPQRDQNKDRQRRERWWQLGRSGDDLRSARQSLTRYIVTPRVAKHRLFVWLDGAVSADCQLVAIARDDDTTFGILHSRFHELWALRLGSALEDRPRYTPTTTFETFPFPCELTPDHFAASYVANPQAQAIAKAAQMLVAARDLWLNPPELVQRVAEVVPGFPDRIVPRDEKAAAILKTRTLTNLYNMRGTPEGAWLDNLHRALDQAVAAAYGWPADLNDDEVLARLLALNLERAKKNEGI